MGIPGLFYWLNRDGVVPREALGPLLASLPAESFVRTSQRGGEAFDSTRWPLARDAALASFAARRLNDPELARAQDEIDAAGGDRDRLRALARASTARSFAAAGADAAFFTQLWSDAAPSDLAVFSSPPSPSDALLVIESLFHAHYAAADGLYAYHVHRGIPGSSAEPAARLVRRAIDGGVLRVDELISAAIALVRGP